MDEGVCTTLAACGVKVRTPDLCCSWDEYKKRLGDQEQAEVVRELPKPGTVNQVL